MAKRHRPTKETRAEVSVMAGLGIPHKDIAFKMGINPNALERYYFQELNYGSIKANTEVTGYLFSLASGRAIQRGATHADCSRAAMFWAKTRLNWQERTRIDVGNPEGETFKTEQSVDVASLTTEQLEQIMSIIDADQTNKNKSD